MVSWNKVFKGVGGLAAFAIVVWDIPAVTRIAKWLFGAVTGFDFFYERSKDPSWIGGGLQMALNPPPGTALLVAIVGLILIYWTTKPRELRMSYPVIGMLLSIISLAGFAVWFLVKKQSNNHAQVVTPPSHMASAATTSSIPSDSMFSGRPVTGVEIARRIERLEQERVDKDSELIRTRQQLEAAQTELQNKKKIPAPFYTKTDVERLLEASYEITTLLQQKAVPAREAAETFIRTWHELLLQKGEPAFRAALQAVRLKMEDVNNSAWAISNKYQHYNSEIAPILSGVSFAQGFFGASNKFAEAGQNLPQQIDVRTLTFMTPMRDEYEKNIGIFQQWISDTYDRNRTATERFRSMEYEKPTALESALPQGPKITGLKSFGNGGDGVRIEGFAMPEMKDIETGGNKGDGLRITKDPKSGRPE